MDDEASRTRGGFQAGGLGGFPPPPQQGPQQPNTNMGGTTQPQQPGQTSGIIGGQTSMPGPTVQQPTGQGGAPTGYNTQFGPDPAFFQQQPNYLQQSNSTSASNANHIRLLVPQLAHMSDDYLVSQPIDALYRLCREEKQA